MTHRRTPTAARRFMAAALAALLCAAGAGTPPLAEDARSTAPASPALASALFDRFKSLEGEWTGKSTRGWTEATTFRTIAGGSVVVQTSFDAHPGETMMTLYHMDGPRLILTHYCVARNQPRLVATEIGGGGSAATFTFLDATGIPSRDAGHMDKATFTFESGDRFTSRWTWYQDGRESWMEEIVHVRRR